MPINKLHSKIKEVIILNDVIELYLELREIAYKNGNELNRLLSIADGEEPTAFFNKAFNSITLTLELLDCYLRLFNNITSDDCKDVDKTKQENAERIITIQKWCFVETMSAFEYSAKKNILSKPKFEDLTGKIYLYGIMTKTKNIGLLDQKTYDLWCGIIFLRNSLVHNNGISQNTACYQYPDDILHVNKDHMTQGSLKLFGNLTKWLLNESKIWMINTNK